jgi:glycosyltransferase involved in cell wall biosynthesis
MDYKSISIIIPLLNEEKYIDKFIFSLRQQTYPNNKLEFLFLVDDDTIDGTEESIRRFSSGHSNIKIIRQVGKKTVPVLLNQGIKESKGEVVVRLDAHSFYASNYLEKCIEFLEKTGADNVGGPVISKGHGFLSNAIALALSSVFGVGNSLFRMSNYEGFVDTVPFGAWRRSTFDKFGFFDESLKRNQDDEFNFRITKNGGNIFMTPQIKSEYYVRGSLSSLWRQYWQFGYFKVKVMKKHKSSPSLRALVPGGFLMTIILSLLLSLFSLLFFKIFSAIFLFYLFFLILGSIFTVVKRRRYQYIAVLPLIFMVIHFSYGLGFLESMVSSIFKK